MKVKEFKEYLSTFNDDEDMSLVVVSRKNRLRYPVIDAIEITDMPCVFADVTDSEPLEESEVKP